MFEEMDSYEFCVTTSGSMQRTLWVRADALSEAWEIFFNTFAYLSTAIKIEVTKV